MAARTAVVAGTATAVSGRVARRQQSKYAAQDAEYVQEVTAPAPAAAAPEDPTAAKIQQLADLHASGALTDEEFAAAKAKALGI